LEDLYALTGSSPTTARELTCSALVYSFLVELSRLCSAGQASPIVRLGDKLSPVFTYIEGSFEKPITLSELAALVGLTPQYFCSLFKKATSQTPVEYINLIKLRHAKALLLQTELPVREIAHRVGIEDPSYFCALFKRYEHMTPMAFRTLRG
jgi:AraC-like DNA-binding protein